MQLRGLATASKLQRPCFFVPIGAPGDGPRTYGSRPLGIGNRSIIGFSLLALLHIGEAHEAGEQQAGARFRKRKNSKTSSREIHQLRSPRRSSFSLRTKFFGIEFAVIFRGPSAVSPHGLKVENAVERTHSAPVPPPFASRSQAGCSIMPDPLFNACDVSLPTLDDIPLPDVPSLDFHGTELA